ncbi:hypothetical protein DAT35_15230 [Vitiosangium sp. GDMCC 1.1324]|nr:hypothetical protein DAT35_15230 [Vitiosangium sp. GDMCC 1.1324]
MTVNAWVALVFPLATSWTSSGARVSERRVAMLPASVVPASSGVPASPRPPPSPGPPSTPVPSPPSAPPS